MFLKSLTLKGFKSFADTTTLDFEPGVTVVVGPNGSGKSNIVDAVAWVLGAQGPRTVRSAKMEDVIFAGTPKRAALGRAEVSLTIDNSAGLLPIEFSEVTITRTLFRSGDSEYAINSVPCRLLDVQDLLSDTGVGRQQHVIVSQGQLDAVLNTRPEDRRMIIEEAAGILKYRKRKERSERRLESTEGSLTRLQDLLREVRRQLRPLERQADAARRHGDLAAELTALRRHLAGRELLAIEARLAASAGAHSELTRAVSEVTTALSGLDAQVIGAEAEVTAARSRDDQADLGEALSRAEGLRQRSRGLEALLAERRRSIERDRAQRLDSGVVANLEAEAADLSRQLAATELDAQSLVEGADELGRAEARLAAETGEFEQRWSGDAPGGENPAAEVRGELAGLRSGVERGRGELRRIDQRVAAVRERAERSRGEKERAAATVAACDAATDALTLATDEANRGQVAAEAAVRELEERRRAAEGESNRWSARSEALGQALDEARARAGAQRLAGVRGVVGTLLELVEVDQGWETAFEVAVGEALAAVVVDGVGSARSALDELTRLSAAGAVVALPEVAGTPGAASGARSAESLPPGCSALRDRVRAWLPGVAALLDQLLAQVAVVDGGWGEAIDVALARPDMVVVSAAGDRCAGGVWRTGGSGTGATGAALEEARERAVRAAVAVQEATEAFTAATDTLAGARRTRADALRAGEANVNRRRSAQEELRRAERAASEVESDARGAQSGRTELLERVAREESRIAELEGLLPELEREAAAEAERTVARRAARARLAERAEAVAALRRDVEVRAAGLEERRAILKRRLAEVNGRLARNVAERDEATRRRARLEGHLVATDRLVALVAGRTAEVGGVLEALRVLRREEADATRELVDRLDQLRRQRAMAERQLVELRERLGRAELDGTEARVRLETLTETVRRELDCEPEATRDAPCPEMPPGTSPSSRVRELERELRLMGPINPLALEEYEALRERHEFLEAQLEDVKNARRELTKVIRAIDAEIVEVFRAAWADVSEHFEKLFATLFPGGQGRLRLTDPDHLLETGIEVEARPSGKNVRRLSLLSGGERSLTALAFLFAVFRSRPSPFYLMDEVEAALDDVNLHRFLDLLHEFRSEAQLVVVSHQKRTMEAADCLYGVTMPPGGSSRVVTERVTAGA